MSAFRINFTKPALKNITPPTTATQDTYYDTNEKGLICLVSQKGAKTFYLYKKVNGRPERIKLGSVSDISIEQARKKAKQEKGRIADGINPNVEKKQLRDETPFSVLFADYLNTHAKVHKKTWQEDERMYKQFLASWGTKRLSAITTKDVEALHKRVGDNNGKYIANRLFALLSTVFNKAISKGWKGHNPCKGVKKFKEKSRDRFIQPDEMPQFFESLDVETNHAVRDYVRLSLLTGARKSNVLAMQWNQISSERKEWRIPETKNGEAQVIPLSDAALAILEARKEEALEELRNRQTSEKGAENKKPSLSEWVFPGTGSTGHLAEPRKVWERILRRAEIYRLLEHIAVKASFKENFVQRAKDSAIEGLEKTLIEYREIAKNNEIEVNKTGLLDLRLHDLRRTLGSYQAATGASTAIIGKSLGHKSIQSTVIYARLNIDPVRESVKTANEAILKAGTAKPTYGHK